MKVILTQDIEELGKCGDVVQVKSGYGRNYLLPRNLAVAATRGNLRAIDELRSRQELRSSKQRREAESIKNKIEKVSCTAEVNVGEDDKVFGSVTASMIADLLKTQGVEIDRKKVLLEEPLKALGVYTVPVKINSEVTANLKVWVVKKTS
jgi:large subunit ribosomal protein L9